MGKRAISSVTSQLTPWLVVSIFVASMLNSTLYGFNTAALNAPAKVIFQRYNQTFCERGACLEDESQWDFMPIAMMIFVAGGTLGAFLTGMIANRFGRKNALWYHEFIVLIGAGLSASSWWVPELLYVGRVFIGFACGISVCLVSTYLTEIAPREIRGVVGCFHQLGIVIGILVAQILGLPAVFGNSSCWWILVAFPAIPAILSIAVLKFCPESPRYLFMNRHDPQAARAALEKLRKTEENIEADIEEYKFEQGKIGHGTKHISFGELLSRKEFRMPLLLACGIQITQQLTGINAIFSFSGSIFIKAGVTEEQMPFAVLATGIVNLLVTIVSMVLMERCGRRHLLIWPMCLMAVSMFVIIFSIHYQSSAEWLAYVSIGCIILFIAGFAPGLGPIAGLLPTELFRQEARSMAVSLAMAVQWGCNLLLNGVFKFMLLNVGEFVFAGFLVLLVASIIFFYIYMPETKNKTFHEIQETLAFGRHHKRHGISSQQSNLAAMGDEKDKLAGGKKNVAIISMEVEVDPEVNADGEEGQAHLVLDTSA